MPPGPHRTAYHIPKLPRKKRAPAHARQDKTRDWQYGELPIAGRFPGYSGIPVCDFRLLVFRDHSASPLRSHIIPQTTAERERPTTASLRPERTVKAWANRSQSRNDSKSAEDYYHRGPAMGTQSVFSNQRQFSRVKEHAEQGECGNGVCGGAHVGAVCGEYVCAIRHRRTTGGRVSDHSQWCDHGRLVRQACRESGWSVLN